MTKTQHTYFKGRPHSRLVANVTARFVFKMDDGLTTHKSVRKREMIQNQNRKRV